MLLWGGNISEMQEKQGFPQSVQDNFVILITSISQLHTTSTEPLISPVFPRSDMGGLVWMSLQIRKKDTK